MLKHAAQERFSQGQDEQNFSAKVFIWLLVFAATIWPDIVSAEEAGTLGKIICNGREQTSGLPLLMDAISFVAGAVLCLRGLLLFKKHADNPNDSQWTKALANLVAGGCLVSLPIVAGVMQNTILGTVTGASSWSCSPGTVDGDGTKGLDVMMQKFVKDIHAPMMALISFISILVGLVYIVRALHNAAKTGTGARGSDAKSVITSLVIGAILISLPTSFSDVMQSLFGITTVSDMFNYDGIAWSKLTGSDDTAKNAKATVNAVLAFVQILGLIAFVRGWMVLKAALDGGQATVPQGLTFIVAGAMAVNIDKMIKIFNATFGTDILK